jgi:hypothetical protein
MCKLCVDAVREIFPDVPEGEIHEFLTACTCFGFGSPDEVRQDIQDLRKETADYHECYALADEINEEGLANATRNATEKLALYLAGGKKLNLPDKQRKPIGKVVATVEFPIYEGDKIDFGHNDFPWFEYREPGITTSGEVASCVRACTTIKAKVVLD